MPEVITMLNGRETTYYTPAETGKLLRKALAKRFPGVTFSVHKKAYYGVLVEWTDGPTEAEVRALTDAYDGHGHDGSIDLAYSSAAWMLPDGTVTFAGTEGTAGSGGCVPAQEVPAPCPEAKRVRFPGVSVNRHYSEAGLWDIYEQFIGKYGSAFGCRFVPATSYRSAEVEFNFWSEGDRFRAFRRDYNFAPKEA